MKSLVFSLLAVASLLAAHPAYAGQRGDTLKAFFTQLEGSWSGEGKGTAMNNEGNMESYDYDIKLDFSSTFPQDGWRYQTETHKGSLTEFDAGTYAVNGDVLFTGGSALAMDPAKVLELTPTKVTFYTSASSLHGHIYNTTITYELDPGFRSPSHLTCTIQVTRNDVVVRQETYEVTK